MRLDANENISLETLSQSHALDIFRTIDENRDELREWLPFVDYTKEEKDSRDFVDYVNASGDKIFVILYDASFVGLVGLKDIDNSNNKAETGYWISPQFQNKGIASLSTKRIIEYSFNELNLNRLQIKVAVDNLKSIRVAEKLCFCKEGIQRDGELLVSGYSDLWVFSLLRKEYSWNK